MRLEVYFEIQRSILKSKSGVCLYLFSPHFRSNLSTLDAYCGLIGLAATENTRERKAQIHPFTQTVPPRHDGVDNCLPNQHAPKRHLNTEAATTNELKFNASTKGQLRSDLSGKS